VFGALLIPMLLNGGCGYENIDEPSPFWRTSIGFDRVFDLMDESLRFEPEDHYPPCNIIRTGDNTYRISLAVAGFKPEQVSVTVNQNTLIVSATADDKQDKGEYLCRGIAGRSFERRFIVTVKSASLDDGLLQIELPEAMKPLVASKSKRVNPLGRTTRFAPSNIPRSRRARPEAINWVRGGSCVEPPPSGTR
jgi:molecular chaperone IbpA